MIASNAIAGTASPTVAPPLNASANVFPSPLPLRFAARTAAFTVIFSEIIPAIAESVAPTAKAIPLEYPIKYPIITESPTAMGIIIFISLFRNAAAPTLTASEISIISLVPGFCFETHAANTAATAKDAMAAPIGRSSGKSILYLHA